jgi:hypothetical protein
MKYFDQPKIKIIVQKDGELSDKQITDSVRVSEQTMWWRALVQLIEKYRVDATSQAAMAAGANNPLAMAANCGAHTALTAILSDLEDRRNSKES